MVYRFSELALFVAQSILNTGIAGT